MCRLQSCKSSDVFFLASDVAVDKKNPVFLLHCFHNCFLWRGQGTPRQELFFSLRRREKSWKVWGMVRVGEGGGGGEWRRLFENGWNGMCCTSPLPPLSPPRVTKGFQAKSQIWSQWGTKIAKVITWATRLLLYIWPFFISLLKVGFLTSGIAILRTIWSHCFLPPFLQSKFHRRLWKRRGWKHFSLSLSVAPNLPRWQQMCLCVFECYEHIDGKGWKFQTSTSLSFPYLP